MNEELIKKADQGYRKAEQRASQYFQTLYEQVMEKAYVPILTKDIQTWKHNHVRRKSIFSFFSQGKKKTGKEYNQHDLQWLNYSGKLDQYLRRSFSYIYLRDLGKALDSPDIQKNIQRTVENWKQYLTPSVPTDKKEHEPFSIAAFYRWGQKENLESSIIWLLEKLKKVSTQIPKGMDATHAQRKLIKIIGGVILHVVEEMDEEISAEERKRKLEEAIRLGYSYGLTYPFIDDLLDSEVLSIAEKKQYFELIRTTLVTGAVPELTEWSGKNTELIRYIHSELRDAFEYIKAHQSPETSDDFFEQAYVFFHAQEVDRVKELSNSQYTNEELYVPVILKSASSRLIVRSVISAPHDEGFESRTFFYGIYNQLADDLADMFKDMEDGVVTPYTYYLKYHDRRPDLINPFELYWTVIAHLTHQVYGSDPMTMEVMLDRAINGLKRYKQRLGIEKYNEVMEIFFSGNPAFSQLIQKMVQKAVDVEFFDKLLRDRMIDTLKKDRMDLEHFKQTVEAVRDQINKMLKISKAEDVTLLKDSIIDAANHSLAGEGKRLRPIITWVMGVNEFGLNESKIVPLLKSLEYMHTASLIFDDLPSQDNATMRRGRPTLHQVYNPATAELTGIYLIQKAISEQASLTAFDPKAVVSLIHYSSNVAAEMCRGQAMDLDTKGKEVTVEQLKTMCFYKTGIAFEASLIMPAILAKAEESMISALKKFAHHAGLAFQIKDDLLDVEGDQTKLGKPVGQDAVNHRSTFVSLLGIAGAKMEMWNHYCIAIEALEEIPLSTTFLKQLMNYIIHREN